MTQRDRQVFDEAVDKAEGPIFGGPLPSWEESVRRVAEQQRELDKRYKITLPSGRRVIFDSIEEAREAQYVLNGLALEGKL
jgi:hypothetical protein